MQYLLPILILFLSYSNEISEKISAEIITDGYFDCFDDSYKGYTCEPSTVVYHDGKVFLGNDKSFPDNKSSIFSFSLKKTINCESKTYYTDKIFYDVKKYESSTISPDKKFILFSSSYSYPASDSVHGELYNSTIYFEPNNFSNNGFLHITNDNSPNSIDVKMQIKYALMSDEFPTGPDYIKIEGMSFTPDNRLLFGVREMGMSYGNFEYVNIILAADYIVVNNSIRLVGIVKKVYEFEPDDDLELKTPVGLSSIEYSEFDEKLYIVTSYEHGNKTEDMGAYLWCISIDELNAGEEPHLILNKNGNPFEINHKIEGLTILDKKKILLIGDDDRVTGENEKNPIFTKKLNEAYWAVVKLKD